jgi:hypothetical protein
LTTGSALPKFPQSVPRGLRISWLHWFASATACQVARPPVRIRLDRPAFGDFYFQAFNGSVSLSVAGYNYNSGWISFCWRDLHPLEWQLASLHGQNAKYSPRVNVVRFASELGHCAMRSALRIRANNGNQLNKPASDHLGFGPPKQRPLKKGPPNSTLDGPISSSAVGGANGGGLLQPH